MRPDDKTLTAREPPSAIIPLTPRILDYELLRSIGSGACGEVWLARSLTGSYRAVKLILRKHFKHPALFEKEFEGILKYEPISRSHEGLTDILHVGRDDAEGFYYYVMEPADDLTAGSKIDPPAYTAKTLAAEINRCGRLSCDDCLQIGLALTDALEHLHRQGLIHRDIKPSNIIFVAGIPKLADIGLVADIGQSTMVGTPGYIPPEGPGKPSADLYSLGKVMYELCTGNSPKDFPDLPTDLIDATDAEKLLQLNGIVLKACEGNAAARYQTAQQMHDDLARLARGSAPLESHAPAIAPNNLPAQLTSFVGRQQELAEVAKLLASARLLTLTGAGGCGKTRLALQVAAENLSRFPDGVWFVELAALTDAALVPQAVATALGLRDEPNCPLLATLTNHLQSRRCLLLLDNCEHLIETCARFAESLLRVCPELHILATSRESLEITGEVNWQVSPLVTPEAVQLFVERAEAGKPKFALTEENTGAVEEICLRLDGIPLAIELAAARIRSLSARQIAERLTDRFRLLTAGSRTELPRHKTLRAAVDWSHDLLSAAEQTLFRGLAVFAGNFSLEAAESVCACDVLDPLIRLVEKSLVIATEHAGAHRYQLLETIRQYGAEKLEDAGESAGARDRHLAYFLQLARDAEPRLAGAEQAKWLQQLDTEHDNLRAALGWAAEQQRPEALALATTLGQFWLVRGYWTLGRDWLERCLDGSPGAEGYIWAGMLALRQGDGQHATRLLEEGLRASRSPNNKRGVAEVLHLTATIAYTQGDYDRARSLYGEALALHLELGNQKGVAAALNNLGLIATDQGDYAAARESFEESLATHRELGDRYGIAAALNNLGWVAFSQADYPRAQAFHQESLALRQEVGDKFGIATSLFNLGKVADKTGDLSKARALHEESLKLMTEVGGKNGMAFSIMNLGVLATKAGAYAEARAHFAQSLRVFHELNDKRVIPECLVEVAALAAQEGATERATVLLGAADALRRSVGTPPTPTELPELEERVANLRRTLGQNAFAAAWGRGEAMTMDQAVVFALEPLTGVSS